MFLPLILINLVLLNQLVESTNVSPLDIFRQNPNSTQILSSLINLLDFSVNNNQCFDQLRLVFDVGLSGGKEWALKMIDATAKPQSGILMGNIMHVGNYDECLEIQENFGGQQIKGKYCSALFQPHSKYGGAVQALMANYVIGSNNIEEGHFTTDAKKSFGFCVPKVCTTQNLQVIIDYLEEEYHSPLHFIFKDLYCDAGDGLPLSSSAIAAIFVFALFAGIIVCSTLYDALFYQRRDTKGADLYIVFSIITNGRKLFSTRTPEDNLNCLNGIRVISMMWIVLGHGFMHSFFVPQINVAQFNLWKQATENSILVGLPMAVDTFFAIGGVLVSYLFLKNAKKGLKFSIPMFYLHRILRLTPSLAMVVLLSATLIKYMGSGPFWPVVDDMLQKPCERNWWSTLIYLQNYIHTHDQCVGHAWYLSVDTQMYFISPLILIPLLKWPKRTVGAVLLFSVLNCSYVFEITFKKHLGIGFFDQDDLQYAYTYSPTHVRGTVYLIGMVCGYFVFETRNKPLKLNKLAVLSLWASSLLVMMGILLSHSVFLQNKYNNLQAAFFASLTRVGWAAALSIIILLCSNGYGGLINSFLSSKLFVILIRLNYNTYLLHMLVMAYFVAHRRTPGYFTNAVGFHQFWGDYAYALAASVVWTLSFESPVLAIEKIVFGKAKKPDSSKNDTENNKNVGQHVVQGFENGTSVVTISVSSGSAFENTKK